jgi:hypothetical protein
VPDQTESTKPNLYEIACERFNRISGSIAAIKAEAQSVIQWADDEYDAASENLRLYESEPGIPLPEYRTPLVPELHTSPWDVPGCTQ